MKKIIKLLLLLLLPVSFCMGCNYSGQYYFGSDQNTIKNDSFFGESSALSDKKEPFQSSVDYILANYDVKEVSNTVDNTISKYDFIDTDLALINTAVSAGSDTSKDLTVEHSKQDTVSTTSSGVKIVTQARKFVGKPYNFGGGHSPQWDGSQEHFPKAGVDCSAFAAGIYNYFGYKISGTAQTLAKCGKEIDVKKRANWKAGDLIMFGPSKSSIGHVAIYAGNNKIVHALGKKWGIVETDVNYGPSSNVVAVRRILK